MHHLKVLPALAPRVQTSPSALSTASSSCLSPSGNPGGRRLPASHPGRQLDRITRCFKEPKSFSQASRTRRDGWSSPAASRRREAARGKVRLPRSVDTELGMAQPGRSLNIAGQRKGCERGWGRERDRSQMSNQLNKTTSCRSTRETLPLFATTLCRGVFKRRFSI